MPVTTLNMVPEVPAARSEEAAAYFDSVLRFETDCWDVHDALRAEDPGFVLVDVRGPQLYAQGHAEGAINIPYGKMNERNLASYAPDTLFVVYCSGPHCNGADRAALRLSRLGRPVKKMIGGISGWKYEGFSIVGS
ncbi:MAG: rhodanese-like domain-containing protein [Thermoanaerobaculia bacterium]